MPRRRPPQVPRAIAYLRVSTKEQADSRLGLDAQLASCAAAAVRLGLPLAQIFRDEGVSGSLPLEDRPALTAAVAALRRGDVLLVAKRDRLGRNVRHVNAIEDAARGCRIISAAGEGTDDDGPTGELMRGMMDQFAQYERLLIGQRTKAALAVKKARHERAGTVPYGYRLAGTGARSKRGLVCTLEPQADEQRTLARIRELRTAGLTTVAIAATLNASGSRQRRGTPWTHQRVSALSQSWKPRRTPAPMPVGRLTDVSDAGALAIA